MTDVERVNYQGGPLHGAVLEMTSAMAARVATADLVITTAGQVVDRDGGRYPTIRVVQGPQPRLPEVNEAPRKRARRPRRSTTPPQ